MNESRLRKKTLISLFMLFILAIPVFASTVLIEENIGDYTFIKLDITDDRAKQFIQSLSLYPNAKPYFAYYAKENKTISISVVSFNSNSEVKDYIESYLLEVPITNYQNQYIFLSYGDVIASWYSDNFFILIDENPLPKEIIIAYLEKYPSDVSLSDGTFIDLEEIEQRQRQIEEERNEEKRETLDELKKEFNEKLNRYLELEKECWNNETLMLNDPLLSKEEKNRIKEEDKCYIYGDLIENARQEYYTRFHEISGDTPITEEQRKQIEEDPEGKKQERDPTKAKYDEEEKQKKSIFMKIISFLKNLFS